MRANELVAMYTRTNVQGENIEQDAKQSAKIYNGLHHNSRSSDC